MSLLQVLPLTVAYFTETSERPEVSFTKAASAVEALIAPPLPPRVLCAAVYWDMTRLRTHRQRGRTSR